MLCRAKVNLTLHVGAPISGGRWASYHPVESLVAFADFGDHLAFEPAAVSSLYIAGPFGAGLTASEDNLILRALSACEAAPHKIMLDKQIPVSAGLGGGSANAAGVLRAFDPKRRVAPETLGADVPVCLLSQTAMMEGIGERVTPLPGLGRMAAVLVNPRVAVSTGEVFRLFDEMNPNDAPAQTARDGPLLDRAKSGRNDLQSVAIQTTPIVADALAAIEAQADCQLSRMSGSGATCFGLFPTIETANAAAERLRAEHQDWWVRPCWLGEAA